MTQTLDTSLWSQLNNIIGELKYKRLADVFRFISFEPFETYGPHGHLRIEINLVRKGSCFLHLNNNESITFNEGEMMVIYSHLEHLFEAGPKGVTLMQLEFMPEVFSIFDPHAESSPESLRMYNLFSEENRLIKITNNIRIMRAVQRIINELKDKKIFSDYLVIMYYAELLILLQRHMSETYLPLGANDLLRDAIAFFRKNYEKDIVISEVADHCKISERYLRKLFSSNLNISPLDYLNEIRINKSIELLKHTELSVKEIAFMSGFKSSQYFSRVFKKQTGMTPSEVNRG